MVFWFSRIFFVVRNTFDVNVTKIFLVWWSNLTQEISLLFIIIPVFNRPFFVEIVFESGSNIIAFLRDLVVKALLLKRRTFTLTGAILFKFLGTLPVK